MPGPEILTDPAPIDPATPISANQAPSNQAPAASAPVAQAQTKLARSAGQLVQSADKQLDSADRRTQLAADRTVLAAERTYAAWMRTALAALATGIGAKTLLSGHVPDWLASSASFVVVLFAVFCLIAGVWRQLDRGAPPPDPDIRAMPAWILLAFNGFLMIVSVAVLIGLLVS